MQGSIPDSGPLDNLEPISMYCSEYTSCSTSKGIWQVDNADVWAAMNMFKSNFTMQVPVNCKFPEAGNNT